MFAKIEIGDAQYVYAPLAKGLTTDRYEVGLTQSTQLPAGKRVKIETSIRVDVQIQLNAAETWSQLGFDQRMLVFERGLQRAKVRMLVGKQGARCHGHPAHARGQALFNRCAEGLEHPLARARGGWQL